MKNLKVARRYAKALLIIGKEDGQAETYREELNAFSGLIAVPAWFQPLNFHLKPSKRSVQPCQSGQVKILF